MTSPTRPDDGLRTAPASRDVLPQRTLSAPRSSVAGRAALALALLVGYFALALGVVGSLALLTVQAFTSTGSGVLSAKLAIFTGVVALAIARAVLAVEQRGEGAEDGIEASRQAQPELWALVDDVSRDLGVPAPDDLRLVEDVNAFVHQDTRLLGLVGGRRHMGVGVGLLHVLSVDQLRGVLGHELGHYAGGDTRLSALVYRAGATIERTTQHLGRQSLLGRLFGRYAQLYRRVSLAVRRRQELRADAGAVRVVGRAAHVSALREAQAASAAWEFFLDSYVVPLWRAGTAPEDLYTGFRALLADPVRRQEIDIVRSSDDGPPDPYDSHPSLSARAAHVQRLPDRPAPGDDRPARTLLRDAPEVERGVTEALNARVLRSLPPQRFAFTEQLDATPYTAGLDEQVAALAQATAAVDGLGPSAGLGRTVSLFEAGRDEALVTALTGDRRDLGEQARAQDVRNVVLGPVALSASCALVASGAARWQAGWSGPVRLVDRQGHDLDLSARLEQALDHSGVAGLRPALVGAGVPLEDDRCPVAAEATAPGGGDDVLVVWPDLVRGWARFDGYVTRDLLVLVRQRGNAGHAVRRALAAQYGLGRGRVRAATAARVQAVLDRPLADVARRPGTHVVRWDDLPSVGLSGGVSSAWVLRLPGQPKPFDKLKAEDDSLVPGPDRTAALLRQLVGDRLDSRR